MSEQLSDDIISTDNDRDALYKWKCFMCDRFNEYSAPICEACDEEYRTGIWRCQQCLIDNRCNNDKCSGCGTTNINLTAPMVVEVNSNNIINEHSDPMNSLAAAYVDDIDYSILLENNVEENFNMWECKRCDKFLSYENFTCPGCKGDRKVVGIWRCDKCTLINKCTDVMCDACGNRNDLLMGKMCNRCSRNRCQINNDHCNTCLNPDPSDRWRCQFSYCRTWNPVTEEYCSKCNLWRHGSHIQGDLIRKKCEGGIISVWICEKCHQTIESSNSTCQTPNCIGTRFKIKYCYDCSKYNDGKTLNCEKCRKRL